jgi:hypothetical protein
VQFNQTKHIPQSNFFFFSSLSPSCFLLLPLLTVPWFPRKISDIDMISQNVLGAGAELESDHPGFQDPVYRERRKLIAEQAVCVDWMFIW